MYNAYFGFSRRPFASAPQVECYFPATAIETARQTLARCIERAEGAAMVVGPSGTGKTLLCQVLAEQLKDSLKVAFLSSGRLSTRRNLFQAILYELGQPYREMDEGELRLALVDHLTASQDCPRGMVLLVDEAHSLPLRLLEEIRMLTNVARDGQPQVRLVLAGGCVLEERFAHPKLDSFSQRLVARCYLESLNRTETGDYIQAQVDTAEAPSGSIFTSDACQSVYQATDGVPRLINQVCDHALLLAYAAGRRQLEAVHIEEAWADLQQLPAPLSEESQEEEGGGVIEFGGLEDSPDPESADDPEPAGDRVCLPALRISPETDRPDAPPSEPADQLQHIEQLLGSVQEDHQPSGSIGPELELVFDDPFQEKFEKEEVVTDRCGTGGRLAEDPAAGLQGASHDLAVQTGDLKTGKLEAGELEAGEDQEPAVAAGSGPAVPAAQQAQRETLPLQRVEEPDDQDMLIVEDDYDEVSVATCSIVALRRHEYGQLFSKLRRG